MNEGPSEPSLPPRRVAYGLAALGGAFYFLGWAGFGVWPLALICLVPLWAALELSLGRSWSTTFMVGWLYGTVTCAGGYHWLVGFLEVFSGYGLATSILFWLVFTSYLGLNFGVYGLLYRASRRRGWPTAWVAIPTLLVVEWLYPALFPTYLANSLHAQTTIVQIADIGGPLLVTVAIALVNLSLFEAWRRRREELGEPLLVWAVTVAAWVLLWSYGTVRIAEVDALVEESPSLRVGVVQVNMGIFEKRSEAIEGHRRHLEQSRELESQGELDLIIWPESAFMSLLPRELPWTAESVRRDLSTPILFGGLSSEVTAGKRRLYNTVFLADENGMVRSMYDKTYLLMFGEYLPFGDIFPILYELSPNSGRFTRGAHVRALELGPWRISTPICYEDVLARFTRKMVREAKPHILINLTNDAWFSDSQEPWIHLVLSKFRAIEHRRFLVRSTNSGISAIVDPVGRVVAETGVITRENLRYDVAMIDGETIYTKLGDWPGWLALGALAWMLIATRDEER